MTTFAIPENEIRRQAATNGVTHFATGVAIMKDNEVLVVRRASHNHLGGWYELPGGGVDEGETFAAAAIREVLEETGLKVAHISGHIAGFDYQTPRKSKVRQINLIATVAPGEVVLDPNEHDAFCWVGKADIGNLEATDEIKTCLREIAAA